MTAVLTDRSNFPFNLIPQSLELYCKFRGHYDALQMKVSSIYLWSLVITNRSDRLIYQASWILRSRLIPSEAVQRKQIPSSTEHVQLSSYKGAVIIYDRDGN